jgi:hypothetical protein
MEVGKREVKSFAKTFVDTVSFRYYTKVEYFRIAEMMMLMVN